MRTILKNKPDSTFFVASDSRQTKQKLKNLLGNKIIENDITPNRNTVTGMQEAAVDLFCLAQTEKIYGSYYSTFGHVAAEIGNVELQIIL